MLIANTGINKKSRNIFFVFLLLTVAWMVVIFVFSGRDGDESTDDSGFVVEVIGKVFVRGYDEMSDQEKLDFVAKIEHPVRKTAHAAEYAFLAALSFVTIFSGYNAFGNKALDKGTPIRGCLLAAWGWATIYACTDEIHQLFVPGRGGSIVDVLNDSMGALVSILFCLLVTRLVEKRRMK